MQHCRRPTCFEQWMYLALRWAHCASRMRSDELFLRAVADSSRPLSLPVRHRSMKWSESCWPTTWSGFPIRGGGADGGLPPSQIRLFLGNFLWCARITFIVLFETAQYSDDIWQKVHAFLSRFLAESPGFSVSLSDRKFNRACLAFWQKVQAFLRLSGKHSADVCLHLS